MNNTTGQQISGKLYDYEDLGHQNYGLWIDITGYVRTKYVKYNFNVDTLTLDSYHRLGWVRHPQWLLTHNPKDL